MHIPNLENFLNNYSAFNNYPILKALAIIIIYLLIAKVSCRSPIRPSIKEIDQCHKNHFR